MTREELTAMLSELVNELDYDVWKDVYGGCAEVEELAEDLRAALLRIAERHTANVAAQARREALEEAERICEDRSRTATLAHWRGGLQDAADCIRRLAEDT